jgi:hypothetical protein
LKFTKFTTGEVKDKEGLATENGVVHALLSRVSEEVDDAVAEAEVVSCECGMLTKKVV